jgi:hypothetical protein
LPVNVRNPLDPKAALLWDYLEKTFSAKIGARQATLVQELFRTAIPEGEDPMPHLSKLQASHVQLNSGGENLSDKIYTHTESQGIALHRAERTCTFETRYLNNGGT